MKADGAHARHQGRRTRNFYVYTMQQEQKLGQVHKQSKIYQKLERRKHLVSPLTPEERNKEMRSRVPIFDRPNRTKINKLSVRATKKKTPKL